MGQSRNEYNAYYWGIKFVEQLPLLLIRGHHIDLLVVKSLLLLRHVTDDGFRIVAK